MEFSWHLLGVLPSVWGCEVWLAFSWDLLLLWYFDNCSSALCAMPLRIVQQQQTKKKHKRRRNSKINKKKNNKSKRTIYSSPKIKRIVCLVVTKIKVEEKLKERINNPTTTTVN
uniref:Candidate secreted effector n=1 Tax=Meloidogyne incognita TaxID=6306 RepID=A0A914P4S1_MELIC